MRRSRKWERQVAGSRWQVVVVVVGGGWWLGGVWWLGAVYLPWEPLASLASLEDIRIDGRVRCS